MATTEAPVGQAPPPLGSPLAGALRRDRRLVVAALVTIAGLAWAYMVYLARGMAGMEPGTGMAGMPGASQMAMPQMHDWRAVDFVLTFVMWSVMMVGMMMPSTTPMLLLFAGLNRRRREREAPYIPTACFMAGYLLVWTGFSAAATLLQWALHRAALLSPMMESTSPVFGGALLVGAGVFQFSALKKACLVHCRSPLHFFMTAWRDGRAGALVMGLRHGAYCVGCCWVLMALLFVAGVMNLLWVAAITAFVVIERVVPKGDLVGRAAGGLLIVAGLSILAIGAGA